MPLTAPAMIPVLLRVLRVSLLSLLFTYMNNSLDLRDMVHSIVKSLPDKLELFLIIACMLL